jgi:Na+/H+-dicarboxylate symporter
VTNFFSLWQKTPLFVRIIFALILGLITGFAVGAKATGLKEISGLILTLLKMLATPLILLAILNAILKAAVDGKVARKLAFFLFTNTMAAICIGLLVANIVRPGTWGASLPAPTAQVATEAAEKKPYDPVEDIKTKIPTNIIKPLYDDNVIAVIILGLMFGIALRHVREEQLAKGENGYLAVENFLDTIFSAIMVALHWVIQLVPIAVFCVVASVIGQHGISAFHSLFGFIVAVLLALFLQACFYLTRVRLGSWVSPLQLLRGGKDALLTAFSTASSTATMPLTYQALKDPARIGVRERSASLGALVGGNFNNDGTALYEAMAPLFIAQAVPGLSLSFPQQIIVAFMAVIASVGAAGIPEAGLVTMLLVFKSVNLPIEYVLLLLPVDWFLDRARTAINVMGDMTVACLIDGKTPPEPGAEEAAALAETGAVR